MSEGSEVAGEFSGLERPVSSLLLAVHVQHSTGFVPKPGTAKMLPPCQCESQGMDQLTHALYFCTWMLMKYLETLTQIAIYLGSLRDFLFKFCGHCCGA